MKRCAVAALTFALSFAGMAQAQVPLTANRPDSPVRGPDIIYVPTPQATVGGGMIYLWRVP